MARVKLTKNELKNQKNALKRFNRYLPTLTLKKQQLQMVIHQVEERIEAVEEQRKQLQQSLDSWISVFGEAVDCTQLVQINTIHYSMGNIAGVEVPVYEGTDFTESDIDLFGTPPWVDRAVETIEEMAKFDAEITILQEQIIHLEEELLITAQRVNLFEKVKIPEAQEIIRKITIALGDQQTAAVVRGKISKNKLVEVQV